MENMMRPIVPRQLDRPEMVWELIDQANKTWDQNKLDENFLPMDADLIPGILLPTINMEDFWGWSMEKSGEFTVRSAYRMLVHTKMRRGAWLEGRAEMSSSSKVVQDFF